MSFRQQGFSSFGEEKKSLFIFRSPLTFTLAVAGFLLAFYNIRFWRETTGAFWSGSLMDSLFIASLFCVLLYIHSAVMLLVPGKRLLKLIAACGFIIAALAAYSADTYGVFIDRDMVRNLFETDRREAAALFNPKFVFYVVVLGILPALGMLKVDVRAIGLKRQLVQRVLFLLGGAIVSASLILSLSPYYSSFAREHKSLRYLLSPGAAIQGTIQYARSEMPDPEAGRFADHTGKTVKLASAAGAKPLLVFLVVGETARAQNFQLGGYQRETNPELAKTTGVLYFNNVTSCGTSTAISLPCMFSHLTREHFSVAEAGRTANLIDALAKAGIALEWRDNNSGSKGVSARIPTVLYGKANSPDLCNDDSCFDDVLLKGLDAKLQELHGDSLIAFHQMGSHGPAYSKRYPAAYEKFVPVCKTNELKECSTEQIVNAYDNTILYTDHNIAQQIRILQSVSDRFDTLLLYVSDHGESLGEKGLYLHGAPYIFAPDVQKQVPMVLWMSDGYKSRFGIEDRCMQSLLSRPYSHDNLYHTMLGAMNVRNDVYRRDEDMLATCRSTQAPHQ